MMAGELEGKKVAKVLEVMNSVYGTFSGAGWKPKPYAENKSRYLWTDAFGVCNFLTVYEYTKEQKYLEQAAALVENVHDVLGRNREGTGRLPGASDDHPLSGGLRIGKSDPEGPGMSEDGQYYHYLVKWLFALNRMSIISSESRFNRLGMELARAVHDKFVYRTDSGAKRMYWKMSLDLQRPLVSREGGLDPFAGYVIYRLLEERAEDSETGTLAAEIEDCKEMIVSRYEKFRTWDALGVGQSLWVASWYPGESWAKSLFRMARKSSEDLWNNGDMSNFSSGKYRLAFREFGTSIGVQIYPELRGAWAKRLDDFHEFWSEKIFDRDSDITPVMFCTSLLPGVYAPQR